jgi:hypothetical protein
VSAFSTQLRSDHLLDETSARHDVLLSQRMVFVAETHCGTGAVSLLVPACVEEATYLSRLSLYQTCPLVGMRFD